MTTGAAASGGDVRYVSSCIFASSFHPMLHGCAAVGVAPGDAAVDAAAAACGVVGMAKLGGARLAYAAGVVVAASESAGNAAELTADMTRAVAAVASKGASETPPTVDRPKVKRPPLVAEAEAEEAAEPVDDAATLTSVMSVSPPPGAEEPLETRLVDIARGGRRRARRGAKDATAERGRRFRISAHANAASYQDGTSFSM